MTAARSTRRRRRSPFAAWARAAVRAGDRGGDRQAEPGAAARARLVGAREALEGARQERPAGSPGPRRTRAARPRRRRARALSAHRPVAVAQRVVDQVGQRLLEPRRVGVDAHAGRGLGASGRPSACARVWKRPATRAQHVVGVERLAGAPAAGPGRSGRSPAGPRRAAKPLGLLGRRAQRVLELLAACARRAAPARARCAGSPAACAARARRRRRTPARA